MKRWLTSDGRIGLPTRQGVQRAVLIVVLSASAAWQWAEPQGHRLPELMRQAQQLEQQIGALQSPAQTRAQHSAEAATLAEQAQALRQRYWRPEQAQQWLINAHRHAQVAGVLLLDWRIAPVQPQAVTSAASAAPAPVRSAALQVRMQLQGQQERLIGWFAGQVQALPAAQILDWQWQAQGEPGRGAGQLTLLWSVPIGPGQEGGQEEAVPAMALAQIGTKRPQAKPAPAQPPAPHLPVLPDGPDAAAGTHHWPDTDLSQLRFVGLLLGTAGQHSTALLSQAAPGDAAAGPAAKASAQAVLVSVRVGDRLGTQRVRVTHINDGGLSWQSTHAQGSMAAQTP